VLQKLKLTIRSGATNIVPIRVESALWKYASISAVAQSAPLRITVDAAPPDGWRAAIMNVRAVGAFAAANNPPKDSELRPVTRVDATTIEFNEINGWAFKPHTGGGQVAYREPLDLAPYNGVRMDVKTRVDGEPLVSFTLGSGLRLDNATPAIWFEPTVEQSRLLAAKTYVFDIELLRTGGGIEAICSAESTLTVLPEITTTE